MLDALSDFWKPAKKDQPASAFNPDQLQLGSVLVFGFVPQASLSGRKMSVSTINTYQFGDDALTSFVLTNDKDPAVSMIVAEAEGEKYLAISRRLNAEERIKMFSVQEVNNVIERTDSAQLICHQTQGDFKGWVVGSYKRELQGVSGRIFSGDFRKASLPNASEALSFTYALLVSDSNEHAIEIEKYADGRIEMYATVYRRLTDIGEVTHPGSAAAKADAKPELKLATPAMPPLAPQAAAIQATPPAPQPLVLQELKAPEAPAPEKPAIAAPEKAAEPAPAVAKAPPAAPAIPEALPPVTIKDVSPPVAATSPVTSPKTELPKEEKAPMELVQPATSNGAAPAQSGVNVQPTAPSAFLKQEVKAVSKNIGGLENESIECDLRVANKIIDEAIRNEMRLTDVVRRIIELPVAYPEAVHIPITLSDEDYSLLAIRYGISSADRNAIKRRILEDLNTFSGGAKKAA